LISKNHAEDHCNPPGKRTSAFRTSSALTWMPLTTDAPKNLSPGGAPNPAEPFTWIRRQQGVQKL